MARTFHVVPRLILGRWCEHSVHLRLKLRHFATLYIFGSCKHFGRLSLYGYRPAGKETRTWKATSPSGLFALSPSEPLAVSQVVCCRCVLGVRVSPQCSSRSRAVVVCSRPGAFVTTPMMLAGLLVLWGIAVVGDSPQFSVLNANTAPPEFVGSALTLVNSIGFLVTVLSVQLMGWLWNDDRARCLFVMLAIGPVLGLLALRPVLRRHTNGAKAIACRRQESSAGFARALILVCSSTYAGARAPIAVVRRQRPGCRWPPGPRIAP